MSTRSNEERKVEELEELRRELSGIKLSLNIVGEHSKYSGELLARRDSILGKIRELEKAIQS